MCAADVPTAFPRSAADWRTGRGAQGGEKAHHLLHTKYKKLDVYKFEGYRVLAGGRLPLQRYSLIDMP